jgi:S-adenosylmethionine:tRNA ribosyltransferase-isomerase
VEYVTLHVGLGTFLPVKAAEITDHTMHSEAFTLMPEVAERLNRAKSEGRRVIAVGSTACRVLESCADQCGRLLPGSGETSIFIYPGYQWRFIDGLLTNFHLPQSTLLMLVSALIGREQTLALYELAKQEKYRFYSFGDAMLLL